MHALLLPNSCYVPTTLLISSVAVIRWLLLAGETEGVFGADGTCVPEISPESLPSIEASLGGSRGTDVTGGMASKVQAIVFLFCVCQALCDCVAWGSRDSVASTRGEGGSHDVYDTKDLFLAYFFVRG